MQHQVNRVHPARERGPGGGLEARPEIFEHRVLDRAAGHRTQIHGGNHLPAEARGGFQKSVERRTVAAAGQQFTAVERAEGTERGRLRQKGMGLMQETRDEDAARGHVRTDGQAGAADSGTTAMHSIS